VKYVNSFPGPHFTFSFFNEVLEILAQLLSSKISTKFNLILFEFLRYYHIVFKLEYVINHTLPFLCRCIQNQENNAIPLYYLFSFSLIISVRGNFIDILLYNDYIKITLDFLKDKTSGFLHERHIIVRYILTEMMIRFCYLNEFCMYFSKFFNLVLYALVVYSIENKESERHLFFYLSCSLMQTKKDPDNKIFNLLTTIIRKNSIVFHNLREFLKENQDWIKSRSAKYSDEFFHWEPKLLLVAIENFQI